MMKKSSARRRTTVAALLVIFATLLLLAANQLINLTPEQQKTIDDASLQLEAMVRSGKVLAGSITYEHPSRDQEALEIKVSTAREADGKFPIQVSSRVITVKPDVPTPSTAAPVAQQKTSAPPPVSAPSSQPAPAPQPEPAWVQKPHLTKEDFIVGHFVDPLTGQKQEIIDPAYFDYVRGSGITHTVTDDSITWAVPAGPGELFARVQFNEYSRWNRPALTYGQIKALKALKAEEKERKERAEEQRRREKTAPTNGQQLIDGFRSLFWSKEHKAEKYGYRNKKQPEKPPEQPQPPDDPEPDPEELARAAEAAEMQQLTKAYADQNFIQPSFDDPDYMLQLADEFAARAEQVACEYPRYTQYAKRLRDRAQALIEFVEKPEIKSIELTEVFPHEVHDQFSASCQDFDRFSGNLAEKRLHDELRWTIQEAVAMGRQFSSEPQFAQQVPAIYNFCDMARQQDNPRVAFDFADLGYHLLNATKLLGNALIKINGVLEATTAAIQVGAGKAVYRTGRHVVELICHPIDTTWSDIVGICKLAKGAAVSAYTAVFGETEDRDELWQQACAIANHVANDPSEITAFIFQSFLPLQGGLLLMRKGDILRTAVQAMKWQRLFLGDVRLAKELVNGVRPAYAFTAPAVRANELRLVLEPLKKIGRGVAKGLQQQYGNLTELAYASGVMPKLKSLKHLFLWEVFLKARNPLQGFHFIGCNGGKLVEKLMLKADKHGIRAGFFRHDCWEKFSTFFPENWNRVKVMQKIEEAFKNPILKEANKIIGETAEGIRIEVVFCLSEGQVRILTAYPLYNQGIDKAITLVKQLGKSDVCCAVAS